MVDVPVIACGDGREKAMSMNQDLNVNPFATIPARKSVQRQAVRIEVHESWGPNPFATPMKPVLQAGKVQAPSDVDFGLFRSLILEAAKESAREAAQETARLVLEGLKKQRVFVEPGYFNIEDAGNYIGKSLDAMTCLLRQHEIPIIKLGTRVYIAKKDLDTYMLNRRH